MAVRFVMVGGFLGAGKTTTLARLARWYQSRGRSVGLVTNDQAQDLVDTNNLRAQGFLVEEVPGACFCCRFDDLVEKVSQLEERDRPDVILAEPVGSCTDLVATVVQPLKDLFGARFQVAPYAVVFKPSHGLRILRNDAGAGFSAKAAYIFQKQLEEADAILLNRVDEQSPTQADELSRLVTERFPDVPMLKVSARTGQGFDAVQALLEQDGEFGRRILKIDYDVYAAGEAELGWLNSSVRVTAAKPIVLDDFLMDIIHGLRAELLSRQAEVAHLKVIGLSDDSFGVANLVSSLTLPELSLASQSRTTETDLIINARVAIEPSVLEELVRSVITQAAAERQARAEFRKSQSLRPGRPTPTHRYATAIP